ncbi:hypothetical protein [Pseudomonas sp. EpS/L25]|uniref:hypothetical protein n=1 Tax=Pseudomonas sp. EpS/L25 TaxID=1749078 RepID=UPI0007431E3F|nr:hypothetical protein [Pseudomonas sp. EpS/L25]KUM43917.1 hypothetical protein AR540_19290 [Pseudomonas sp. EpS/L25]
MLTTFDDILAVHASFPEETFAESQARRDSKVLTLARLYELHDQVTQRQQARQAAPVPVPASIQPEDPNVESGIPQTAHTGQMTRRLPGTVLGINA